MKAPQKHTESPTQDAGEAKVTQLDDSSLGEEDVLRLDVTVDALRANNQAGV